MPDPNFRAQSFIFARIINPALNKLDAYIEKPSAAECAVIAAGARQKIAAIHPSRSANMALRAKAPV